MFCKLVCTYSTKNYVIFVIYGIIAIIIERGVSHLKIIITQWALDAYLELKHGEVLTQGYYQEQMRPDTMLLAKYPDDPKFGNGKFWSQAKLNHCIIPNGYKMKWHQVGNGRIQLRLPVGILNSAYLCQGYVKRDEKIEKRMLAKFKTHLQLIQEGRYIKCGELI